jgi:hypothetical protein
MRSFLPPVVQGPIRDAVKEHGCNVADLSENQLRAVILRDFQVGADCRGQLTAKGNYLPVDTVKYTL